MPRFIAVAIMMSAGWVLLVATFSPRRFFFVPRTFSLPLLLNAMSHVMENVQMSQTAGYDISHSIQTVARSPSPGVSFVCVEAIRSNGVTFVKPIVRCLQGTAEQALHATDSQPMGILFSSCEPGTVQPAC